MAPTSRRCRHTAFNAWRPADAAPRPHPLPALRQPSGPPPGPARPARAGEARAPLPPAAAALALPGPEEGRGAVGPSCWCHCRGLRRRPRAGLRLGRRPTPHRANDPRSGPSDGHACWWAALGAGKGGAVVCMPTRKQQLHFESVCESTACTQAPPGLLLLTGIIKELKLDMLNQFCVRKNKKMPLIKIEKDNMRHDKV